MRRVMGAIVVAMVVAAFAGQATAHTGRANRLRLPSSDTGSANWQRHRVDSPLDQNQGRLKLAVAEQTGDDFALGVPGGSGLRGKLVDLVTDLSFDYKESAHVGAGAPRISVAVDTNGDGSTDLHAFLAAFHCQSSLSDGWGRADFTGRNAAGCTIFSSDGGVYTSTGTEDAWTDFANDHAGARVVNAFLVMDEVGTAFVDRVAFGRHMYVRKGTGAGAIKHCPGEAVC